MTKEIYDWEFYKDSANLWRWRKTSKQNKKIVGSSSESFSSRYNAVKNAKIMGYNG